MLQLARLVRWWFGMQAFILVAASALFFGTLAWRAVTTAAPVHQVEAQEPPSIPPLPLGLPSTRWALALVGFGLLSSVAVSAIAWWALRKGWRSARFWALSASLLNLSGFGLGTVFGLVGLAVFWRKEIVLAMAMEGPGKPPERISGDGTHKYLDHLAQVLAVVSWIAASFWWQHWAAQRGLVRHYGLQGWLEFLCAIYTGVLLHELGHFLAGRAADMSIRAVIVGPLAARIQGGRWRFRLNTGGFLGGGAVSMVPLNLRHLRGRQFYMLAAGPVFSLLTGMVAIILAFEAPGTTWEGAWFFLALTGSICICDFVINLIPLRPEGLYSDGAQMFQLVKGGPWADAHLAFAMVGSSLVTPLRPSQYDLPLLERVARFHQSGKKGALVRLFIAMHHLETGRTEAAKEAWRAAELLDHEPSSDTSAEFVFLEAALAEDFERASKWWQRVEAKGDSKHELDYWRGRTAVLWLERDFQGARLALEKADGFARRLPKAGAYEYDRWCLDLLRKKLAPTATDSFAPDNALVQS
jgi:hypothetical protein